MNHAEEEHQPEAPSATNEANVSRRQFLRNTTVVAGSAALALTLPLGTTHAHATVAHPWPAKRRPENRCVKGQLLLWQQHDQTPSATEVRQQCQQDETLQTTLDEPAAVPLDRVLIAGSTSVACVEADTLRTDDDIATTTRQLNTTQASTTLNAQAEVVATPNWLVGGTPHVNATGGPGGRPVAPDTASLNTGQAIQPWQFILPPALTETPPEQRGAGVEIFILDTAPTQKQLTAAYQRWHSTNPLIARLLASDGPLRLHTIDAVEQHLEVDVDYFMPDHEYKMADHGLFVAGIIHTIAPKATLHLVRVLNDYGLGSYESILRGLQFVHQSAHGSKVLINASLCFDLAQPDQDWLGHWSKFDPFWAGWHPDEIRHMAQPLDRTCQLLHRRGHQIIAAAGNDREGLDDVLPPARFPAACPNVLGVGALRRDNTPASYSNVSDLPQGAGLATFGGHSNATTDVTNPTDGMLGVYIGTYPDKTPNTTGFARWAGTSFATPVITGALAVLVADGYTTEDAIQKLRDADPAQTPLGEVFPVTQGTA